MQLATSPIRSEARARELRAWDEYKLQRHVQDVRDKGGKFGRARLLSSVNRVIDLRGAWLDGICVGTVDLRGAMLDGASFRGAWLKGAHFDYASLRNADFSPMTEAGVPGGFGWGNARLGFADFSRADMEGAVLAGASMVGATFRETKLAGADLQSADLSQASLIRTDMRRANLSRCRVYGIAAWDIELCDDDSLRRNLIISPDNESPLFVDDLEVAQFVYLLLSRPKLRRVINAVSQRGVLILGRFSNGGLEVLEAIARALRQSHYLPIIVDFERPDTRDLSETVRVLAGLSRFIVADLSGGSVPHELASNVPFLEVPVVPVLHDQVSEYSMFRDLFKYPWVIRETVRFSDHVSLEKAVASRVIVAAEERRRQQRAR
jgi:hypothetical protein